LEENVQKLLIGVDKLSTFVGQLFSWSIVALTALISWEVFSRYILENPHSWTLDMMVALYGILFMAAGAYTLAKSGHVRGDVLYGFFSARTQATLDLILYIIFFMPGIVALTWAGWNYFNDALLIKEKTNSAVQFPLYPVKFFIPLAGGLLLLQGIVEVVRCVVCIKNGEWPSREHDVEEVDVDKLKAMVNVKDEDIEKLDDLVVHAPTGGKAQ
jgi:TRAP-type mannitol/chloroaromatic compound transport system permease small subunit